jgi:hypothetical protein
MDAVKNMVKIIKEGGRPEKYERKSEYLFIYVKKLMTFSFR